MAKYLLTEDQEGKSGYTFWNNRGVLKAVKNIKYDDGNQYIVAFDQSFDNDQVIVADFMSCHQTALMSCL